MEEFNAALAPMALLGFQPRNLLLFADYSPTHRAFGTYSYLLTTLKSLQAWDDLFGARRDQWLPDQRRMAAKRLSSDGLRTQALSPFLDAASSLEGVLVTVSIRNSIRDLMLPPYEMERICEALGLRAPWKRAALEHSLRIVHFAALLASLLIPQGGNVIWVSDNDAAFANDLFAEDSRRAFRNLVAAYAPVDIEEVGCVTVDELRGSERLSRSIMLSVEDLLGVADLTAFACAELQAELLKSFGEGGGDRVCAPPDGLSHASRVILDFYSAKDRRLNRFGLLIDSTTQGHRVRRWDVRPPAFVVP